MQKVMDKWSQKLLNHSTTNNHLNFVTDLKFVFTFFNNCYRKSR